MPTNILVLLILLLTGTTAGAAPVAKQGLIDLSDWDFQKDGVVNLRGEYEFYWKALHDRTDLLTRSTDVYAYVPGPWNGILVDGEAIGGDGFATYKLNILLPRKERLALKLLDFATSYRVFIDDAEVLQVGQPGSSEDESYAQYAPQLIEFEPAKTRVEVLFQVANFDHRLGGAWAPVILGNPAQISRLRENAIATDLLLVGAIFMIGLFNFAIYALRREYRASLFLGMICIFAALRLLSVGERFGYLMVPELTWAIFNKIEYVTWYLLLPAFGHFMYHSFPRQVNFRIMYLFDLISVVAILMVLATPLGIFSHTVPTMQVVHLLALFYGAWCLVNAATQGRNDAAILVVGFLLLCGTSINDILISNFVIEGPNIVGWGVLAFITCQSLLIIYRFATSLSTVEQQHDELLQTHLKLNMQEKLRHEAENVSRSVNRRFRQSQQFEALGILAHDVVSNLKVSFLAAAGNAVAVAKETSDNPKLVEAMEQVRRTANQGVGVIEDVLSLSRLSTDSTPVNINDLINEYVESSVCSALTEEHGVVFERSLSPQVSVISGSPLHIRRILENLINNAVDGQPRGGRINIATEEVRIENRQLFYDELTAGAYIVLSVEDDGKGIPPGDLDMVFQPFYSRKEGQPTGLGMSVVRAVVRQHNGGIDVVSEPSQGTRFDIYLPII